MAWEVRGLIEGFYGPPWTWDQRLDVSRWCGERSMDTYVYVRKDDPLHREQWQEPYDTAALDGFRAFAADAALALGFALSPGLSIDYASEADRRQLSAKVRQVVGVGARLVVLALDDIPPAPGLGEAHAALTTWLLDELDDRAELVLVPTEYTGTSRRTPYLDALADGVPAAVRIAWTGPFVVNDTITVADARARASTLGGRAPLIWDNFPVNDALMADRLFLGPMRGRDPGLVDECCGYLANPMVQPHSSRLPLASTAGYLDGADPVAAWETDIGDLRVFAEACDGELVRSLVASVCAGGSMEPLQTWLQAAAVCAAPGLEDEASAWVAQAHREAKLGLAALRLLAALDGGDAAAAAEEALGISFRWPSIRRSEVTVMGPRCSVRPMLGQDETGAWTFRPESITDDQNAIDALVRHALARLAETSDSG